MVLNGIAEVAVRGDLIDRCLFITLPTLTQRADESTLWKSFQEVQPRVLGAVVNAVCMALKNRDRLTIRDLPRMADFTLWVEAAAPAFGWQPGEFLTAYRRNRAGAVLTAIEASPIARALLAFMDEPPDMPLLIGELLNSLTAIVTAGGEREAPSTWPKSPQALGGALRRLAPALRAIGIEISFPPYTNKGAPVVLHQHRQGRNDVRDGTADVRLGEEVGEDSEEVQKSSSPPQPAKDAHLEEREDSEELFSQSLKERKNINRKVAERESTESSSLSSHSSQAATDAAFTGEELQTTSSPSSPSSSHNGTDPHPKRRGRQAWPYPKPDH